MIRLVVGVLTTVLFGGVDVKIEPIVYAQEERQEEVVPVKEWNTEEIKQAIRETFPEEPELMIKVAECESGIKNVPGQLSDDGGVFQINIVHKEELDRLGLDRYDIEDNIKFARYLYDKRGLDPWKNSKKCWNK